MSKIEFSAPAKDWNEALPVGNGRMGAMAYGHVATEVLQLNQDSVWYGGPRDRINPSALENLPQIRSLINEGRISEAQELCAFALSAIPEEQRHYEPLGNLYVLFEGDEEGVTDYHRELDLESAVASVSFAQNGITQKRELIANHPDGVIALHIAADRPGGLSFHTQIARGDVSWNLGPYQKQGYRHASYNCYVDEVRNYMMDANGTPCEKRDAVPGNDGSPCGKRDAVPGNNGSPCEKRNAAGVNDGPSFAITMMTGQAGGSGSVAFACGVRVIQSGGRQVAIGNSIKVEGADEAVILVYADTSFYHEDYKERILAKLSQLPSELAAASGDGSPCEKRPAAALWQALLTRHIADYTELFGRIRLTLPESESDVVRLFDFGRYLMIAGSRPGSQPLNLQGIWNKDMNPMWGSKYTININAEMNYWPAGACGLAECEEPFFDLMRRMLPNGREVARRMYGCGGFAAHHNTDIWGDCAPQDVCLSSTYWVLGAAWMALHVWEHYRFTRDIDFLRRNSDLLFEAAEFVLDYLTQDGDKLTLSPSISPENSYRLPNGETGVICKGATMDNQITRELFEACRAAASELAATRNDESPLGNDGPSSEKRPTALAVPTAPEEPAAPTAYINSILRRIEEELPLIPETKLGSDGRIMEWNEEYEELDPGHRHISHLFGLYPGHQITPDKPELMEGARRTLAKRLESGGGHTGWSRAWIINMYARLRDGESAYRHVQLLMEKSLLPNLFDNHPPFQIDGNFGFTAGVLEMLATCEGDETVLLPALPEAWHSGSVTGLRLPNGKSLNLKWENGKVVSAETVAFSPSIK